LLQHLEARGLDCRRVAPAAIVKAVLTRTLQETCRYRIGKDNERAS
jgi:hypothetical protein